MIPGVPSLTNAHAAAHEFVLDALFSSGTRCAWPADVGSLRLLAAAAVRIPRSATGTLTGEGSWLVIANCPLRTRINGALVDVSATSLHSGFPRVTVATETSGHVVGQHTVSIRAASQVLAWI